MVAALAGVLGAAPAAQASFSGGGYSTLYYYNNSPSRYCQEVHWRVYVNHSPGGSASWENMMMIPAGATRYLDSGYYYQDQYGTRLRHVSPHYVVDRYHNC